MADEQATELKTVPIQSSLFERLFALCDIKFSGKYPPKVTAQRFLDRIILTFNPNTDAQIAVGIKPCSFGGFDIVVFEGYCQEVLCEGKIHMPLGTEVMDLYVTLLDLFMPETEDDPMLTDTTLTLTDVPAEAEEKTSATPAEPFAVAAEQPVRDEYGMTEEESIEETFMRR